MAAFPPYLRPHWVKSQYTLHGATNAEGTVGLGDILYLAKTSGIMYFSRPGEDRSTWRGVRYSGSGFGVGIGIAAPIGGSHGDVDYPLSGDDDFGALFFEHKVPPVLPQLIGATGMLWCPGGAAAGAAGYSGFGVTFLNGSQRLACAWQRGAGVTVGTLAGVSLTRYDIAVTGFTTGAPK